MGWGEESEGKAKLGVERESLMMSRLLLNQEGEEIEPTARLQAHLCGILKVFLLSSYIPMGT